MFFITRCLQELKRHVQDLFGFSKAEAKGVWVLVVLLWFAITLRPAIRWYEATYGRPSHTVDGKLLDSLVAEWEQAASPIDSLASITESIQQPVVKKHTNPSTMAASPSLKPFDINQVAEGMLAKLPAIKPALAQRIIKYRDRLGGFVNKKQYQEVYGLQGQALASLEQFTYIVADFIPRQIDINNADFKTLLKHPYLSYEVVQQLVRLRKQRKGFTQLDLLLTEQVLDSVSLEKIRPYLTIRPFSPVNSYTKGSE
jgi:competence protein ComEA